MVMTNLFHLMIFNISNVYYFPKAQDSQTSHAVNSKDVDVSTVIQHGHAVPISMEYNYAAIKKTEFS